VLRDITSTTTLGLASTSVVPGSIRTPPHAMTESE
jgi:hypothetical protein